MFFLPPCPSPHFVFTNVKAIQYKFLKSLKFLTSDSNKLKLRPNPSGNS